MYDGYSHLTFLSEKGYNEQRTVAKASRTAKAHPRKLVI